MERYYIVDKMGNVWAESESKYKMQLKLESYTKEEREQNELEIIKGK